MKSNHKNASRTKHVSITSKLMATPQVLAQYRITLGINIHILTTNNGITSISTFYGPFNSTKYPQRYDNKACKCQTAVGNTPLHSGWGSNKIEILVLCQ